MVRKSLINFAKRVPLIQFRKGGKGVSLPGSTAAAPSQASSKGTGGKKMGGGPAIEDWELPARFARKPLDPLEAEYINNGGIPN